MPETLALTVEDAALAIGEALAAFDPELGDYTFLALGPLHERMGAESPLAPWVASAVWPDDPDVPLLDAGAQADLAASTSAPLAERLAGGGRLRVARGERARRRPRPLPARRLLARGVRALATAFSRSVMCARTASTCRRCARCSTSPTTPTTRRWARRRGCTAPSPAGFGKATAAVVELVASTELLEGAPLEVRYGGATAELLDYGFAPRRPEPAVSLAWTIEETDFNFDDKLDVLETAGLADDQPFVLREGEAPPAELLAFPGCATSRGPTPSCSRRFVGALARAPAAPRHREQRARRDAGRERLLRRRARRAERRPAARPRDPRRGGAGLGAAELASIRYAERRALESAARWFDAQLELPASSVEYYQRRLRSLNLDLIETAEDLDALRAAGRVLG